MPLPGALSSFLLTLLMAAPVAGALVVALLPRDAVRLQKGLALAVTGLVFALSLLLVRGFEPGGSMQFVEQHAWMPAYGIQYHLGIDGISLWLVILTTFLTPLALLGSWSSIHERVKEFNVFMLLLEAGMLGVFFALDLFLFYVFWEAMLIPMYFLIGIWGHDRRIYAAVKFFLYTMAGSALMLVAFLVLYQVTGAKSFDLLALAQHRVEPGLQMWLFAAFALAFAIKVPMFPFHTWLPDAHVEAPTAGSVILAAVLLKMGTYGFVRFAMPLFPNALQVCGPWIAGIALVGIVYGALVAMVQPDLKKLVAYSSVSHMGFAMLGLMALNPQGMAGSMMTMLNHGVSTGALFLLVGVIYERRHTRELSEFGGLAKAMPVYATIFVIIAMSSIGLPGTNGFVGEFMIIMGTIVSQVLDKQSTSQAAVAAFGVILAAVYMLHVVQKMFFGPIDNPKNEHLSDMNTRETVAVAPLVALVFVIGLFPNLLLSRMTDSVNAVLEDFVDGRMQYEQHAGDPSLKLRPQRGGPLEQGYPEAPGEKKAVAMAGGDR